jgi:hypothetical protein
MDHAVARFLLAEELAALRGLGYRTLVAALPNMPTTREVRGPDGVAYQIERAAFWDIRPGGPIRLIVSIDDGGLAAFKPLTADDIVEPP